MSDDMLPPDAGVDEIQSTLDNLIRSLDQVDQRVSRMQTTGSSSSGSAWGSSASSLHATESEKYSPRHSTAANWRAKREEHLQMMEEIERNPSFGRRMIDSLAKILNTHNPHGAIRNVLSGNVGAWNFGQLGEAMEKVGMKTMGTALQSAAVGVAGAAFTGAFAVWKVIDSTQKNIQDQHQAAANMYQFYSNRLQQAQELRFSTVFLNQNERDEEMRTRIRDITRRNLPPEWARNDYVYKTISAFGLMPNNATEITKQWQEAEAKRDSRDRLRLIYGDAAISKTQIAAWLNSNEVEGKLELKNRGMIQVVKDFYQKYNPMLAGLRYFGIGVTDLEADREKFAREQANEYAAKLAAHSLDVEKEWYQRPEHLVLIKEWGRYADAQTRFSMERYCQPNPI